MVCLCLVWALDSTVILCWEQPHKSLPAKCNAVMTRKGQTLLPADSPPISAQQIGNKNCAAYAVLMAPGLIGCSTSGTGVAVTEVGVPSAADSTATSFADCGRLPANSDHAECAMRS